MGYVAVGVLALVLWGCGSAGSGVDEGEVKGYLLHEDVGEANMVEGVLFVQFVPDESAGGGRITGLMHTATPFGKPNMPSVFFRTANIQGTVDGSNVFIEEENPGLQGAPGIVYIDYHGTLEGDTMRLTREAQGVILSYEGEAATFEDFGAAAEELAAEGE